MNYFFCFGLGFRARLARRRVWWTVTAVGLMWRVGASCEDIQSSTTPGSDEDSDEDDMEADGTSEMQDNWPADNPRTAALHDECTSPLFCGSSLTRLDTTLLVMNVCRTHKVSNACISELLHLFSKVILPSPNTLPSSEGAATTMLCRLGLQYDSIDACRNGCVLFRREYADMDSCPFCNTGRFKIVGLSRVPMKVLRHFPLVARLRRMFSVSKLAALMTWHGDNASLDGRMRGPFDSPQWQHVRENYIDFSSDFRNIHLGMCVDGLNPHSQKWSTHSLWPILLLNYNIPPWLTIKNFFIMLCLLIPGPDAVTAGNIDVFLSPLIEELRELWVEGVMCNDAACWRGETRFRLRAMLLWCVHDFPAYAMMAGTSNKGYCACPVCGPNTPSRYSEHLSKVVYGGLHR